MENNENMFVYTYSAPQNEEIRKIREKYLAKEETKLEQLRRLDASTSQKGLACSLVLGIASCLLFGTGMCCAMLWDTILLIPGILMGCIGIIGMALALPMYSRVTQKARDRIAPEILRLTNEMLNGQA